MRLECLKQTFIHLNRRPIHSGRIGRLHMINRAELSITRQEVAQITTLALMLIISAFVYYIVGNKELWGTYFGATVVMAWFYGWFFYASIIIAAPYFVKYMRGDDASLMTTCLILLVGVFNTYLTYVAHIILEIVIRYIWISVLG